MLGMFLWGGQASVICSVCLTGRDHSGQSGSGILWIVWLVLGREL